MAFEWDEAKRRSNIEKHQIDFKDAAKIFDQSHPPLESPDHRHVDEIRVRAIGRLNHGLGAAIVVVYTWRGTSRRLISARLAKQRERDAYDKKVAARIDPDGDVTGS